MELRLARLQKIGEAKLPVERRGLLSDFVDAYPWSERRKAEGEREALRRVLIRFLEKRFGPVPGRPSEESSR
jgi:hypothetical protein